MKIILTYTEKKSNAEKIVKTLLKERLAACIGMWSGKFCYWWKGKIETTKEFVVFIKTRNNLVNSVINRIKDLHDYELPVINVMNVETTGEVEKWLNEVTK